MHSVVKTSVVSQYPPHEGHWCIGVAPTRTGSIDALQLGHGSRNPGSSAGAAARPPQCGQNWDPANIEAKHDGHVTAASAAAQYSQRMASAGAGAPQLGQLSEPIIVGEENRRRAAR